jgi:hypothetical protein
MKLNLNRGVIIASAFTVLCLGSCVLLLSLTINYNRLYPAVNNLTPQITVLRVQKGAQPNQTILVAHLTIANPSDYSGLQLASGSIQLSRPASNQSMTFMGATQTIMGDTVINAPLSPHSSYGVDITLQLPPENASYLYSFTQASNPGLLAHVTISFDVITFLNSVTGHNVVQSSDDIAIHY